MVEKTFKSDEEQLEYMKNNLCFSCGNEREDKDKQLCDACQALADQKFYEIPTYLKAKRYFKKYLKRDPTKKEKSELKKQYKEAAEKNAVLGIIPAQCPYCDLLMKNNGVITGFIKDSEPYERFVVKGEIPKLVCKRCGDLSLYVHYQYNFEHEDSVKVLEYVSKLYREKKEEVEVKE